MILYPHIVKRIYDDKPPICARCEKCFLIGEECRYAADPRVFYCVSCIGFFLSRYGMTFTIKNLTPEEMRYQKVFDEEAERMGREGVRELCTVD